MIFIFIGRIYTTSGGGTIPSEHGSCHPRRQPLRIRPLPRRLGPLIAAQCRKCTGARSPTASHSARSSYLYPLLRSHLTYVRVFVSMLLPVYAVCLGSSGITGYMPTAIYLSFRFICGYCGSTFIRGWWERQRYVLQRRQWQADTQRCQPDGLSHVYTNQSWQWDFRSDNNPRLHARSLCLCFSKINLATNRHFKLCTIMNVVHPTLQTHPSPFLSP